MRTTVFTLLPAVLLSAGMLVHCAPPPDQAAMETGMGIPTGLPGLPEEAAGWRAHGDPQHYVEDDLYLYINGGAVTWIECGFRQVRAREYVSAEEGRLTLEIFEMSDADAAGCIYHLRAGDGGEALDLADGGQCYDYYLEFRSGRFLVTLTSLTASDRPRPGLTAVAREVERLLKPWIHTPA